MSQKNVEIVRRSVEAYERGDIQAMLDSADPELITHRAPPQPDAGTWHGPEGFLQALAGWVEGFDKFEATTEEIIDANDDQVITRSHQRALGTESRVPIEADFWLVHTIKDQKVVRLDIYASKQQALGAVGLREYGMSQENVETVLLAYDRLNSGDTDGFLQLCATGFEFHDPPALPGAGMHIGHEANRAWLAEIRKDFADLRFQPEKIIDAGGDRVVVACRTIGHGKLSGAQLDMVNYNIWTVSNGAIVSCLTYDHLPKALKAA